jgi:hypothetical protein
VLVTAVNIKAAFKRVLSIRLSLKRFLFNHIIIHFGLIVGMYTYFSTEVEVATKLTNLLGSCLSRCYGFKGRERFSSQRAGKCGLLK